MTSERLSLRTGSAVLCLWLVFAACARKTPVTPPEFAAPQAITSLGAENKPEGIQLTWQRPRLHADGSPMNNLAGFRVERSQAGTPFEPLAALTVSDRHRFQQARRFRYLDLGVAVAEHYEYRVFAYTLDEYVSQASNVADIVRFVPVATPTPAP